MYELLKPFYKPAFVGACSVKRKDGGLTTSICETKKVISDHLAALLDGSSMSMEGLIVKDRAHNMKWNNETVIDCIDWGCLPSLSDVSRAYAHLKPI